MIPKSGNRRAAERSEGPARQRADRFSDKIMLKKEPAPDSVSVRKGSGGPA